MNKSPIYVAAESVRVARNFVELDLDDDPSRLCFVDSPDRLRGLQFKVLFLHPTAIRHRDHALILGAAVHQGFILAHLDDKAARLLCRALHT